MDLDYNSTTAKVYRWFYGTPNMPNSGCTYFRKAIIAYLLLIPIVCFCLPVFFFEKRNNFKDSNHYMIKCGMAIAFYFCLYCVFAIGSAIYSFYNNLNFVKDTWQDFTRAIGVYCLWWVLAVGIVLAIIFLIRKIQSRKKDEETKPNIIIEFIKAKYNKICPTLNWKNKDW